MAKDIIVDHTNDIRAAVLAAAEVVSTHLGLALSPEEMPDPYTHRLFSWMKGKKWFNIERVKHNVAETIRHHGIHETSWEGVFQLLIPEITHVCFEDNGSIVVSPWNDGCDF